MGGERQWDVGGKQWDMESREEVSWAWWKEMSLGKERGNGGSGRMSGRMKMEDGNVQSKKALRMLALIPTWNGLPKNICIYLFNDDFTRD